MGDETVTDPVSVTLLVRKRSIHVPGVVVKLVLVLYFLSSVFEVSV